jgi:hypothetical protein
LKVFGMAASWHFQSVSRPAAGVVGSIHHATTSVEARDDEATGTRTYEAFDNSGPSPRSIGRHRTLVDAKAACETHRDRTGRLERHVARPADTHEQLKRLLARESAKS